MTMIGLRVRGGAPEGASAQEVAEIHYRAALVASFGSWRDTFVRPLRMFPPDDLSNPLLSWWKTARSMAVEVATYVYEQTVNAADDRVTLEFARLDREGRLLPGLAAITLISEEGEWRVERAQY
jgi:hypothetical protein